MGRPKKLPPGMWQRGEVYYARFKANGREVRKRLSTDLAAAKLLLNELRARADKADFGIIDNNYPWVELRKEFLKWVKQLLRGVDEYIRDLDHFEAYCKVTNIREITPAYVIGYRNWRLANGSMRKPAKSKPAGKRKSSAAPEAPPSPPAKPKAVNPRTINKEVATLRNMLNKGVAWGMIGSNPIAGLKPLRCDKPTKERRALSVAEIESIFAASPSYFLPVLKMFVTTGIRRDELVHMKFSDVDFERRSVTVRAENSKNHKPREIFLNDDMFETIQELAEQAEHRQPMPGDTPKLTEQQAANFSREHVFVTTANTPWKNNILRAFYMVCKNAGIKDGTYGGSVDIHSLRASFTTIAIDNGASPKAIQAILGHSTLGLTMGVYAKATERAKRDAIAALPFGKCTPPEHIVSFPPAHTERTKVLASS